MATVAPAPAPAPAPAVEVGRPRPVYTRLAVLGLLFAALAPATGLIAALVAGMDVSEDIAFFGVLIVVPLIAAALVWRFGLWAKIVGIVVGLASGFMLFWMVFGLAYPSSVADFVPGVLLPLGVLLAVIGGAAALVQQRRGHFAIATTPSERIIGASVLAIAALALVVSGALMLAGRSTADATDALSVTIKDFAFEETYRIPADEATTLVVRNSDPFTHTFTVPDLGIDEVIPPGRDVVFDVTAPAGTYTLYCEPHSNMDEPDPAEAGMAATLIVE